MRNYLIHYFAYEFRNSHLLFTQETMIFKLNLQILHCPIKFIFTKNKYKTYPMKLFLTKAKLSFWVQWSTWNSEQWFSPKMRFYKCMQFTLNCRASPFTLDILLLLSREVGVPQGSILGYSVITVYRGDIPTKPNLSGPNLSI